MSLVHSQDLYSSEKNILLEKYKLGNIFPEKKNRYAILQMIIFFQNFDRRLNKMINELIMTVVFLHRRF